MESSIMLKGGAGLGDNPLWVCHHKQPFSHYTESINTIKTIDQSSSLNSQLCLYI